MKNSSFSIKTILVFLSFFCITISSSPLKAQIVEGNFKGHSIEKINGNFYVFGFGENNEIKVAMYDKKLELVKEVSKTLSEKIKSPLGIPYFWTFTQRNLLDIRFVYKSGIVGWLTYDLNLNEIGLQQFDFSKGNKNSQIEPMIYNPLYSNVPYIAHYEQHKSFPGFFIKNNFYQFLATSAAEFSNMSNDKYSYYNGESVFRKLERIDKSSPFYRELSRTPLSESGFFYDLDPTKYSIQFVNQKDSFLYFLTNKKTYGAEKEEIQLIKINENSLKFEESIDLNLDSVYPELGSTLYVKTYYDSINQRIIQIGNYTGTPFLKKWWTNNFDYNNPSLQCKGYYICEFDLTGKVTRLKKLNFPDYDLKFTLRGDRFYENFKTFCVEDNGVIFLKDGSIKLMGENSVLTYHDASIKDGGGTWHKNQYYYSPVSVSFMNISSNFEKTENRTVIKDQLKKNTEIDIRDDLIEFLANDNLSNSIALFAQTEIQRDFIDRGENQSGMNTQKHLIYSPYYGMKYLKIDPFDKLFLYTIENSVIFDKVNKNGKFQFRFVPNKG